jgi:colanic acid/amylovoran biosynthesis glycosyltransferase
VRRVAHAVSACFERTETFVYDIVTGCRRFEAWCLTEQILNQEDFPFPRITRTDICWESYRLADLVARALHRLRPGYRRPLHRALVKVRPALVHAHFGPKGWEVFPYCQRLRIPLLTSFYGYDASSLPLQPGWKARLGELFARGDAFAVEGPAMRQRLEALGCPADKIHILPIPVHGERYTFQPRTWKLGERLRILFVGRLVPKKGLAVLLKALALAAPELGDCELRIIGGGEEATPMQALAREYRIDNRTRFLGFQPRSVMIEEMNQAHLLVVPSQTAPDGDSEGGAPTILIEAQACGLPVVATTHADIPFVVAPPSHAFLAQEGNAQDFASKLVSLVRQSANWPNLATDARRHVENQHGPGNFQRLEDLYEQVIREYRA